MATVSQHAELRQRRKKGPVELISRSPIRKHTEVPPDNDLKKERVTRAEGGAKDNAYSPVFWYELKYTITRCVLMVVIFFVLNFFFNHYVLDPVFHRGSYYQDLQRQRRINEIRSRVCPQGAIDCNVDLSHLSSLDI